MLILALCSKNLCNVNLVTIRIKFIFELYIMYLTAWADMMYAYQGFSISLLLNPVFITIRLVVAIPIWCIRYFVTTSWSVVKIVGIAWPRRERFCVHRTPNKFFVSCCYYETWDLFYLMNVKSINLTIFSRNNPIQRRYVRNLTCYKFHTSIYISHYYGWSFLWLTNLYKMLVNK